MARKPKIKQLDGARLLKEYASWIYCTGCETTVAYLCYVTYDLFEMNFTCKCGSCGRVFIEFEHEIPVKPGQALSVVKNRLCCPEDNSPLLSIVEKNLANYSFRVVCNGCNTEFSQIKSN